MPSSPNSRESLGSSSTVQYERGPRDRKRARAGVRWSPTLGRGLLFEGPGRSVPTRVRKRGACLSCNIRCQRCRIRSQASLSVPPLSRDVLPQIESGGPWQTASERTTQSTAVPCRRARRVSASGSLLHDSVGVLANYAYGSARPVVNSVSVGHGGVGGIAMQELGKSEFAGLKAI